MKWTSLNELVIHVRPIEAVCQRIIKFVFDDDEVTYYPSSKQPIRPKMWKQGKVGITKFNTLRTSAFVFFAVM